ncbi:Nfo Endonuclease IV [Pyrenophora tritici-repentis]|nr:Nfo Endonuclease IV [Pyrenophora tritici-repentis]
MAKKLSSSRAAMSSDNTTSAPVAETAPEPSTGGGRKRKAGAKPAVQDKKVKVEETSSLSTTARPKRAAAKKPAVEEDEVADEVVEDKVKAKAKTTRAKKASSTATKHAKILPPLEQRTQNTKHRIGAHVSIAGGVHNAIINTIYIGANAFAMFMKNQRKWESKDIDQEHVDFFVKWCEDHKINAAECCLPHGSYLVNLAHPDPAHKKQSYDSFLNDLSRCHRLGIRLYNFHPGNSNATTREEGIITIAENINQAHADPASGKVATVLETMASLGNTIGGNFTDIAAIIRLVNDKSRVGVCLDTCHVFAAGYDLRTPEAYAKTIDKFDKEIGLEYLKAFHVNDSKAPFSSHRDVHARIGTGYLGLQAFHNLMNDERFHGLPMVLETPCDTLDADGKKVEDKGSWAREIKMLESLVGMDIESDEFKALDTRLQQEGATERERIGDQVNRKAIKDAKPKRATKKASKKKVESEEDGDEE